MAIQSLSLNRSVPVTHLVKARLTPGKIALPVKKSQSLYSNFKHVTGIPAPKQGPGYSLSKLQALNSLIERLGRFGKKPENVGINENRSPDALTSMISKFAGDLHQLTRQGNPYADSGGNTGILVNITA